MLARAELTIRAHAEFEKRRRDFHRFLRNTMPRFIDGWVYSDLCSKLEKFARDVADKKSPRLIVCLPPRHLKSQTCSVRFPVWCLLNNPTWEVAVASYSQDLANKFSRWARGLVEHEASIKLMWPNAAIASEQSAVTEWKIATAEHLPGGTFKAVGRGAGFTGSGADVLVCDDMIKDHEEADSATVRQALWDWYSSVAITRLAPGGGVLVIQTRWNQDDLVGRLLKEQETNPDADKWDIVEYKAIAESDEKYRKDGEALLPERFSVEQLLKLKGAMIPRWWESLYQQRPIAKEGNLFKSEHFKRFYAAPDLKDFDAVIQVWDLRFGKSKDSGSWVVGWVMGRKGAQYYVLDETRGRWSYAESRDALRDITAKWPQAMAKIIENKANGPAIESDLENEVPGILLFDPRGDKYQRAERILPLVKAGNVFFPEESAAAWTRDAISELESFPQGAANDRVDVLSMGLAYLFDESNTVWEVTAL
jgi:predicted phage terminase large subunit-like protein